jgi:hypothetical protein
VAVMLLMVDMAYLLVSNMKFSTFRRNTAEISQPRLLAAVLFSDSPTFSPRRASSEGEEW